MIGLLCYMNSFAQEAKDSISDLYLEDQLYISLHYNILTGKPQGISQTGFSGGLSFGFVKDIPLNKDRNIGLGIGVGYLYNVYIQNLKISNEINITTFSNVNNFNSNKFQIHSIELPLEIRWRNSTPIKYKFWRVYGGGKLIYNFLSKSQFTDNSIVETTKNINEFSTLSYGVFVAAGYSTWNLYVYYGLSPMFKNASLNGNKIDMRELNVGLSFYIL